MTDQKSKDNAKDKERNSALLKAGFAAGIGSAAIAAALLYASKSRKPKPRSTPDTPPAATD